MTHKKTDKERYIGVVANQRETRDQEKEENTQKRKAGQTEAGKQKNQ